MSDRRVPGSLQLAEMLLLPAQPELRSQLCLVDAHSASQATCAPGKYLLLGFVLKQFPVQNRPLWARQRSELGIERRGFEGFIDV